ncbi:MAG: LysM-like peptidoglycan-binding domain-containing protein [Symbiopectobacterium sp.]
MFAMAQVEGRDKPLSNLRAGQTRSNCDLIRRLIRRECYLSWGLKQRMASGRVRTSRANPMAYFLACV